MSLFVIDEKGFHILLVYHVQLWCLFFFFPFPHLLFQQILVFSTNFWSLHVSNIRVFKPLCSCGRIDYLLSIWVSMNSNPSNLNRAKLDWHLWTFNGHLACLCIFLFILLLCVSDANGHRSNVFHIVMLFLG